jgi:hypothetical protein
LNATSAGPWDQATLNRADRRTGTLPGDLIACGTSAGVMKEAVNTVTVAIDGIGELTNEFRQ